MTVDTDDGPRDYRVGDQVLVTRNDHRRTLLNGTTATVTALTSDGLRLRTRDGRDVAVDRRWLQTGQLDHGYAMTLHKAQGRTVHTTLLLADSSLGAEAGYVGLSRGTHANHLYLDLTDDPRTEQPCQPAPAWQPPRPAGRRRDSWLERSHAQELATHRLVEGLGR